MNKPKWTQGKVNYVLRGEAVDQETIIRQRSWYEDVVRDAGTKFRKTWLEWDMNKSGNFEFKLSFYA